MADTLLKTALLAIWSLNKLLKFLSKDDRKSFFYLSKGGEITRTNNRQVFYNIDIILDAIEKGKRIKFKYNRYLKRIPQTNYITFTEKENIFYFRCNKYMQ